MGEWTADTTENSDQPEAPRVGDPLTSVPWPAPSQPASGLPRCAALRCAGLGWAGCEWCRKLGPGAEVRARDSGTSRPRTHPPCTTWGSGAAAGSWSVPAPPLPARDAQGLAWGGEGAWEINTFDSVAKVNGNCYPRSDLDPGIPGSRPRPVQAQAGGAPDWLAALHRPVCGLAVRLR